MTGAAILEPTGHVADRSKFERIWELIPSGSSFRRQRVERFDAQNLVAYSPIEYLIEPLSPIATAFGDDELLDDVVNFVRDELGAKPAQGIKMLEKPNISGTEPASVQLLTDYLAEVEESFVYGPYLSTLKKQLIGAEDAGEFIYRVLIDPRLGNSANRANIDRQGFARRVNETIAEQERLCFLLPGFPFKDQNPIRCPASAGHVDLADIGLLCQLHIQSLCFFQAHPFGSDHIILSDGHLYRDIFGIDQGEVDRYLANLRQWRNLLNLQGSVHIVDLEDCIHRLPEEELQAFHALKHRVNEMLLDDRRIESNEKLRVAMANLTVGMKRNLNSAKLLADIPWNHQVELIYGVETQDVRLGPLAGELYARARVAAASYAATNVALRRHRVTDRVFQNSLRATIHPKTGQVGVPRSGTVYPWNGVGVFDPHANYPDRIKARQFGELSNTGESWIAGIMPGETHPFYYRRAD